MGNSNSNNKSQMEIQDESRSDRSKFENLIYENYEGTSKTSRTDEIDLKGSRIKENQKKQVELSQNRSYSQSGKKLVRDDSMMSNFDKVSMKNQKIEQLNQILNDQIQTYQKNKKRQSLLHPTQHHHKKRPKRKRTHIESVILGIWIGISLSIVIVLIVIIQINDLSIANQSNFSRDFPTWRGIAIWIFYVWMLGFDIFIYDKFRIRYRQIFKIKPNHYPQAINIFRIAGFHSSMFVILFLFYVLDVAEIYHIPGFADEYFALISWGLFALFLFMPLPIVSNKGRFFVFSLLIDSILSPFRGVTFPITWMTDQAVSMAVPLKDLQYTICYYTSLDFKSTYNVCQDTNRVSTVMIVAVSVCSVRIIQCIRQGYDKGEYFMTPFFFNTLKYAATLMTAVFAFEYKLGADDIQAAWLLFAVISSFYSFVWDLKMDWDLLQKNNLHPFLREKLVFGSPKIYYLIICGNFIMRLAWIITISPKLAAFLGNSNLVFLVTGMIQIFRRGVWNLLRVQKEHIALVTLPPKDSLLNQKALQLQKKLATVQHSLNLQIKMLKFFKKFESNRQNLRTGLQTLNEQNIENHDSAVETYNKKFEEEELKEISDLMQQILRSDSILKKKFQETDNLAVFEAETLEVNKKKQKLQKLMKRQEKQVKLQLEQAKQNHQKAIQNNGTHEVRKRIQKQLLQNSSEVPKKLAINEIKITTLDHQNKEESKQPTNQHRHKILQATQKDQGLISG